mgnify:CR=1 FL=1
MKKILIIGAGFLQRFVIRKAKNLGYYTLTVDGNPNAEGFAEADEYGVVNIVDQETVCAFARQHDVDGVLTAATDYGVLAASYTAKELGLPFVYKSAKPLSKGFKKACEEFGFEPKEAAVIGDQVFTDVLGGKLFGAKVFLTEPIGPETNSFIKIKRKFEKFIR